MRSENCGRALLALTVMMLAPVGAFAADPQVVVVASASSQDGLTPGSILVNHFSAAPPDCISKNQEYAASGELRATFNGTGWAWIGCSVTSNDRVVTTRRTATAGIDIFASDGTEVFTFDTPEIFIYPGDVSVFSDGVLAVCDQGSNWIETYEVDVDNQTATYLGPIAAPGGNGFFGSFVDHEDNLWAVNTFGDNLFKFSRSSEVLLERHLTPETKPEDVVVQFDGFVWVSTWEGDVLFLTPTGLPVGSFPSGVVGKFNGLAQALDGTLYVVGEDSTYIRHLTVTGDLLDELEIVDPQVPAFLMVVPESPPLPGDWDEDGDVDLVDFEAFWLCDKGPNAQATGLCRNVFDFDFDLDVDLHDWWVFHQSFTGEILPANQNRDREGAAYAPPDKRIKRKRIELIPPAYSEVILDTEADPDNPEVVIRRR